MTPWLLLAAIEARDPEKAEAKARARTAKRWMAQQQRQQAEASD